MKFERVFTGKNYKEKKSLRKGFVPQHRLVIFSAKISKNY